MSQPTALKRILDSEGRKQTWLARELSALLGENIDRSQVNGWVKGRTPQPYRRAAVARVLRRTQAEVFPDEPAHEPEDIGEAA